MMATNKSGSTVPVTQGRCLNTHTAKANRRRGGKSRKSKPAKASLASCLDRAMSDYELGLQFQRDTWERKRKKNGDLTKHPDYIHSQLKAETQKLLSEHGVDVSAPISKKCEIEPLVTTIRRQSYDDMPVDEGKIEPEHLKPARPMSEPKHRAGAKGCRVKGPQPDPAEEQFCFDDGTIPVGISLRTVKEQTKAAASNKKADKALRLSILKNRVGHYRSTNPNNAAIRYLLGFMEKNLLGYWVINPDYAKEIPYKKQDYIDAIFDMASRFRANS